MRDVDPLVLLAGFTIAFLLKDAMRKSEIIRIVIGMIVASIFVGLLVDAGFFDWAITLAGF